MARDLAIWREPVQLPEFLIRPFTIREAYIFGVLSQALDKHAQKCGCRACCFRRTVEENMIFFCHEEDALTKAEAIAKEEG